MVEALLKVYWGHLQLLHSPWPGVEFQSCRPSALAPPLRRRQRRCPDKHKRLEKWPSDVTHCPTKKTDPLGSIRSFVVPDILINWFRKHLQVSPIGLCPTIISFRFTSSDHRECQTQSAYLVMFKAEFLSLSLFDFGSWSWKKIWKKTP